MKDWLLQAEKEYDLDILFACEAGSRAWGVGTDQSDYDIRFVFRYRDIKKYLSLKKSADFLVFQLPFDAIGFDLFKAFGLILKSNPSIYEWAYSSIIYQETGQFSIRLQEVIKTSYSCLSLYKHYGSLIKRNVKELSKGDYSLKKQKQFLQAVRAELIRTGIRKTKIVQSPFVYVDNAKTSIPNLYAAYEQLTEAKRNHYLLSAAEVEKGIHLLESSLEIDDNDIPHDHPTIGVLDEWIWTILEI